MKPLVVAALIAFGITIPPGCEQYLMQQRQTEPQPVAEKSESVPGNQVCPNLITASPKGLACLHCLEPAAQEQAQSNIRALRASCLQNVAINYLVDGSFSFSPDALEAQVRQLAEGGRRVFLELYLTNGPSQRRADATSLPGIGADLKPEEFREALFEDGVLTEALTRRINELVPLLRHLTQSGVELLIVPMLEDNLDDPSFEKFAALVVDALPRDVPFRLGRSPCPKCYRGNGAEVPSGLFEEAHGSMPRDDVRDGVVSNDGDDVSINDSGEDLNSLLALLEHAEANNNIFILWNAESQGLQSIDGKLHRPLLELRNYVPLTSEAETLVARFLRREFTAGM